MREILITCNFSCDLKVFFRSRQQGSLRYHKQWNSKVCDSKCLISFSIDSRWSSLAFVTYGNGGEAQNARENTHLAEDDKQEHRITLALKKKKGLKCIAKIDKSV